MGNEVDETDRVEGDDGDSVVGGRSKLNRDFLSSFCVVSAGCLCLLLVLNDSFVVSPERVASVAILWIASAGAGYLFEAAGIPPLLGSLVAGIILQNGVKGFELASSFGEAVETIGLCVILLISSTEIDVHAVASAGGVSLRLTFLPGLVEAAGCAATAHWIFGMPWALACSLGFILAAVSPAIVIPGMTRLQKMGYGVDRGIPSLVMAAASFDDIVAITGFTIAMGIAVDNHDNLALSAFLHGPFSLFLGTASGIIGGLILAVSRYMPHPWQRTALCLELGLLMSYGYKRLGFVGSGAVGTLLMGTIAKLVWEQKRVIEYAQCSGTDFLDKIGHDINIVWDIVVRPLLFGGIGTAFDLSLMPKEIILKSCAIVVIGLLIRVPTAFMSAHGGGLSIPERLFVAASWTPKATVQAALCSVPLSLIKKHFDGSSNFETLVESGTQIRTAAILAIIVTAPIGLLSIQFLGPYLLAEEATKKDNPTPKQAQSKGTTH